MDPINIELIVTLISVVIAIVSARYAINVRKYLREIIDVSKRVSNMSTMPEWI